MATVDKDINEVSDKITKVKHLVKKRVEKLENKENKRNTCRFTKKRIGNTNAKIYIIGDYEIRLTDLKDSDIPLKAGYPYTATLLINNIKCAKIVNNADGSDTSIYCLPSEEYDTKSLLCSVEKLIIDKDRLNRSLGIVCDKLSY